MNVLITGGAGFIGSHIVEHLHRNTDWNLTVLDRLNYAGSLDRLEQYRKDKRVTFRFHDIRAALQPQLLHRLERTDYIIHAAAETHVENSLHDPQAFVESNVMGTFNMLQAAQALQVDKFLLVSTDEVFGPAPVGVDYIEEDRFDPSNPYSATKAGAECLAMAWAKCFQLPLILTRTMNNFGERQHPEKFVPMTIKNVLDGKVVKIHYKETEEGPLIGQRKWLHARNHADAIQFLLQNNHSGKWHIAGSELSNLEIAQKIAHFSGKPLCYELVDFHSSRPGHDLRYSLDDAKLHKAGWRAPFSLDNSLLKTVDWTLRHREWLVG